MRDAGSAFIEILVALTITTLSVVALFDVVGAGAVRARQAENKRAALVVAQSQLAATGIIYPLDAGPVSGTEGPYIWWLDSTPVGGGSSAGRLWRVTVQVGLQSGGPILVQIGSLRLAPAV
jgi:hypothetical protein